MLQIVIIHESNTHKISEIRDLESMSSVSEFDEEKKSIDLNPLLGHEGESVLVTHFIRENGCTRLDYEGVKTLTDVGTNKDGFMYIQYN